MPYKYKDIERKLLRLGFKIVRQKGSHVMFRKGRLLIPVPNHGGKDISLGVEKNILKLLGLTKEEFDMIIFRY